MNTLIDIINDIKKQGILDSIGDPIGINDTEFKIVYQNKASIDFVGNHIGEYCYRAYEQREKMCKECGLSATFKDGKTRTIQRSVSSIEKQLHVEITSSLLKDPDGKIIAGIEIVRDISERKKAEDEIMNIFELSDDMICVADINGYFRKINHAFEKTLGYTKEELLEKPFLDFVHPDDSDSTIAVINEQLAQGLSVLNFENRYICKDGTYRWLLWTSNPIPEAGITYAIARDITERKKSEEDVQKSKDELELRVRERTLELQEKNVALKVLLKQREEDKNDVEQNILSNVKSLIQPYVTKLKRNNSNLEDISYLNIIESNLEEIISPFSQKLSSNYMKFSSKEIQIANLIKEGKKNKEIMEIMNIAFDTVKAHRRNIRKKLGIYNKAANLRNKLLSM